MNNTGSFASAIGGMSPELRAAISRRQQPQGGATSAVSTSAPSYNPSTQPEPVPTNIPNVGVKNPINMVESGLPTNSGESKIIIQALKTRLETLSKIQEAGGQV